MGLVRTKITLRNPSKPHVKALEVEALADTGAMHSALPLALAAELELDLFDRRLTTMAEGHRDWLPYMGPVQIGFGERVSLLGVMVMGDEPVLGAIAMEDMDLVVSPLRQTVEAHPAGMGGPARSRA